MTARRRSKARLVREIRSLHAGMPGIPDPEGWWGWREQPQWGGLWPSWMIATWWRRADLVALLEELRGPWKDDPRQRPGEAENPNVVRFLSGGGPGRGKKDCDDNLLPVPAPVVSHLRRFHGHRDLLIEAVRNGPRTVCVLAMLVLVGCDDATGPPTELQVENQTGATLEVFAAPCGLEAELFAVLTDGASHTEEVEPGCWRVEGGTDADPAGNTVVDVTGGTLHRVIFHEDGSIR